MTTIEEVLSPAPRRLWRDIVAADPTSNTSQLPEWSDSVSAHTGWRDASRAYRFSSGRTVILPAVRKRTLGIDLAERAWPEGWTFSSPTAEGGPTTEEVSAIIASLAESRMPTLQHRFAGEPLSAPRGANVRLHSTFLLDLSRGLEGWEKALSKNSRKAIRKAESHDLVIRTGSDPDFVGLFAQLNRSTIDRWARDRGQPLRIARLIAAKRDRPGRLATVLRHFGDACQISVAWLEGEPVAAMVVVYGPHRAIEWMSAIDKDRMGTTGASTALQSAVIAEVCRRGAGTLDFGEADPGSGIERFKEKFGAVRHPVFEVDVGWLPSDALLRTARRVIGRRPY